MPGTNCAGLSDCATALNGLKTIISSLDTYNVLLSTLRILYPPKIVNLTENSEYIPFLFSRIISKFCLIKILVLSLKEMRNPNISKHK